jgi:hypothetical protein
LEIEILDGLVAEMGKFQKLIISMQTISRRFEAFRGVSRHLSAPGEIAEKMICSEASQHNCPLKGIAPRGRI